MDEDHKTKVLKRAKKYGLDIEKVNDGTLKQLIKVDAALIAIKHRQAEARKLLESKTAMSIASVAAEAAIARATVYNNTILRDYINAFAAENYDDTFAVISNLKNEISERDSQIKMLVSHDAEVFVYEEKIRNLEKLNAGLQETIRKLNNELADARRENYEEKIKSYS